MLHKHYNYELKYTATGSLVMIQLLDTNNHSEYKAQLWLCMCVFVSMCAYTISQYVHTTMDK